MGETWEAISIIELSDKEFKRLGGARTYTDRCDLGQDEAKQTAYTLFVKAGTPRSFYRQTLTKKCSKTEKWLKSATMKPRTLERDEIEYLRLDSDLMMTFTRPRMTAYSGEENLL